MAAREMIRLKSFAYVVRADGLAPRLLTFASLEESGYEVPKGAVEPGETPAQAALREVREEAGIAGARVVAWLGVTQWKDEEQHFFLLAAPPGVPDTFEHTVTGAGIDAGFCYRFRWLDVTPALSTLLVQGCGRFVAELLAKLGG